MNELEYSEKIAEISRTIFSFCMAKTPTREEAEDLSQDILYELLRSAGNLRDGNAFYAFMWGTAGNVYKQWYRKKLKNSTCGLPEDIAAEESFSDDTESRIYLLRRELTLLSEKYRRATILYYIDRRSCSEIASALAISESMVKYLLFKSRKILKEGMDMERTLGELSCNPKTLIPLYSGQGPNRFWQFMQSRIRQNIVSACYNDALTVQQISLETGIPLPYLDDDIRALEDKKILLREGRHYKANIIVITSGCADETWQASAGYHEQIAGKMTDFLNSQMSAYRNLDFAGHDFTENTLRWQLAVILFRGIAGLDRGGGAAPVTGWGESAYIWCEEKPSGDRIFSYSGMNDQHGNSLYFFDYQKDHRGKGDHHDFYGNERYINIFCDLCRGEKMALSEYDLEAIADMIRKGYVVRENDSFRVTVPVYTAEQYGKLAGTVKDFVSAELSPILREMDRTSAAILSAHTPKHLQDQVAGIAAMDTFVHAVCAPAELMIEKHFLSTAWHPLEMPTTYAVLRK